MASEPLGECYGLRASDAGLLRTEAYINGEWVSADDGARLDVLNPATGEVIASVAKVGAVETRRAIDAAEAAMAEWREVPAKVRAGHLRNWFNVIMAHQEDLARLMTVEQGKVIAEARGEVATVRLISNGLPSRRNDRWR